jgi:hypothetical protein
MSTAFRAALTTPTWREATRRLQAGVPQLWLRSSRLAWVVVGVCAFVLAVLCIACRFEYAPIDQAIRLAALLALALLLSSAGWPRLALLLESFALFVATVMVMPALSSICAFLALPLQDDVLAAIDRWMGIDWTALAFWYRDHPVVTHILFDAYASVSWQPALLIFLLAFLDPERLRRLVTASAISLAATVFVSFSFQRSVLIITSISHAPSFRTSRTSRLGTFRLLSKACATVRTTSSSTAS